jgi:hypothetical protein
LINVTDSEGIDSDLSRVRQYRACSLLGWVTIGNSTAATECGGGSCTSRTRPGKLSSKRRDPSVFGDVIALQADAIPLPALAKLSSKRRDPSVFEGAVIEAAQKEIERTPITYGNRCIQANTIDSDHMKRFNPWGSLGLSMIVEETEHDMLLSPQVGAGLRILSRHDSRTVAVRGDDDRVYEYDNNERSTPRRRFRSQRKHCCLF